MEQMKLKEGSNVIQSEGGVKVVATVKGGQVTGYSATDNSGKVLTGTVTSARKKGGGGKATPPSCSFCILHPDGTMLCYPVPCPKLPK